MSTKGLPLDVGVRQELEHQTDFGPNHAKFVEDVWDFVTFYLIYILPPAPLLNMLHFVGKYVLVLPMYYIPKYSIISRKQVKL